MSARATCGRPRAPIRPTPLRRRYRRTRGRSRRPNSVGPPCFSARERRCCARLVRDRLAHRCAVERKPVTQDVNFVAAIRRVQLDARHDRPRCPAAHYRASRMPRANRGRLRRRFRHRVCTSHRPNSIGVSVPSLSSVWEWKVDQHASGAYDRARTFAFLREAERSTRGLASLRETRRGCAAVRDRATPRARTPRNRPCRTILIESVVVVRGRAFATSRSPKRSESKVTSNCNSSRVKDSCVPRDRARSSWRDRIPSRPRSVRPARSRESSSSDRTCSPTDFSQFVARRSVPTARTHGERQGQGPVRRIRADGGDLPDSGPRAR